MEMKIYCDGSCLGNGKSENFGGFGVVVVVNGQIFKTYKKGKRNTTNNEMELSGLLAAVKLAKTQTNKVEIYSDSAYAVNTVNSWMHNWASRGWVKSDKKVPENLDLIKELYELLSFNANIDIKWVKGHDKDKFNKAADELAVAASNEVQLEYLRSLHRGKA